MVYINNNNSWDIFFHDRQIGTTERVSVLTGGVEGNNHNYNPSISEDGRYIVYESYSSNLVIGDTNGYSDIFIHYRQSGATERVSFS